MSACKPVAMRLIRASRRPAALFPLLLGPVLFLSACVADGQPSRTGSTAATVSASQPRHARYDCGDDGAITVEATSGAVRLTEAEGETFDLPASPPRQSTRFGEGGYALVVEGREALWMKAGKEPMTCRR